MKNLYIYCQKSVVFLFVCFDYYWFIQKNEVLSCSYIRNKKDKTNNFCKGIIQSKTTLDSVFYEVLVLKLLLTACFIFIV